MTGLPQIRWYETLDSTNSEARRLLSGLDNLSVIVADRQTAGRGQGDHVWTSAPGENLTFTLVLKYSSDHGLKASDAAVINAAFGRAMTEFLSSYGIEAWMKLPNDIWVGDRKICGILIENILKGKDIAVTLLGIGLNVNQTQFPEFLPNPVSMAQLTGRKYPLEATLKRLLEALLSQFADYLP